MNEIINLENKDGIPVVSSREIAERFGKRHDKLTSEIKRMYSDLIGSTQNGGHPMFMENMYVNEQNNQEYREYLLTRDGFSLLVMGFTGSEALTWKLKYIDAFNKMEEALQNQGLKKLPTTYKEALIELLDQVEKNEVLTEENKVLLPKAEYHDDVLNKTDLLTTTIIAKDLGFPSATKLNVLMYENKVIYKNPNGVWTPYANYEWLIKDGYADYRSYTQDKAKPSLQWTEKGRKWILESYEKWAA